MSPDFLSWIQFGDLHIRSSEDENYQDFLALVAEAKEYMAGHVDFAFLPGDNADQGTEEQYKLVQSALDGLNMPVHAITGDHDKQSGSLELFQRYLEPELWRALDVRTFRLLFLNALDGLDEKSFDCSSAQMEWIAEKMREARAQSLRPIVFMHLYPSELATAAQDLRGLLRKFEVELVAMGHTHYNEVANDGCTIYETTRSTGQIEEGPPGFSVTTIDGDVVSWKFKVRGEWPLVMITSPADHRLVRRPHSFRQLVRGIVPIRARVWGAARLDASSVTCSVNGEVPQAMERAGEHWVLPWNTTALPDGIHRLLVRAKSDQAEGRDEIDVLVGQSGRYVTPVRSSIDHENVIGAYPSKGILGTKLGPNQNGTKGPWPSWRLAR